MALSQEVRDFLSKGDDYFKGRAEVLFKSALEVEVLNESQRGNLKLVQNALLGAIEEAKKEGGTLTDGEVAEEIAEGVRQRVSEGVSFVTRLAYGTDKFDELLDSLETTVSSAIGEEVEKLTGRGSEQAVDEPSAPRQQPVKTTLKPEETKVRGARGMRTVRRYVPVPEPSPAEDVYVGDGNGSSSQAAHTEASAPKPSESPKPAEPAATQQQNSGNEVEDFLRSFGIDASEIGDNLKTPLKAFDRVLSASNKNADINFATFIFMVAEEANGRDGGAEGVVAAVKGELRSSLAGSIKGSYDAVFTEDLSGKDAEAAAGIITDTMIGWLGKWRSGKIDIEGVPKPPKDGDSLTAEEVRKVSAAMGDAIYRALDKERGSLGKLGEEGFIGLDIIEEIVGSRSNQYGNNIRGFSAALVTAAYGDADAVAEFRRKSAEAIARDGRKNDKKWPPTEELERSIELAARAHNISDEDVAKAKAITGNIMKGGWFDRAAFAISAWWNNKDGANFLYMIDAIFGGGLIETFGEMFGIESAGNVKGSNPILAAYEEHKIARVNRVLAKEFGKDNAAFVSEVILRNGYVAKGMDAEGRLAGHDYEVSDDNLMNKLRGVGRDGSGREEAVSPPAGGGDTSPKPEPKPKSGERSPSPLQGDDGQHYAAYTIRIPDLYAQAYVEAIDERLEVRKSNGSVAGNLERSGVRVAPPEGEGAIPSPIAAVQSEEVVREGVTAAR